ncbi:uncharacterized protein LOC111869898 isoform X1 [Cryptotermes secundus]|uniref:uncharacterized protein LOC111869898 isoform X1 n=1 Tax=Cryptotermes secundus TaxID=105785 RepID=UPI000CD7BB48|nr:uncharacterized protein LOC111869898 isoform X1 [Cryptotermes secundus]
MQSELPTNTTTESQVQQSEVEPSQSPPQHQRPTDDLSETVPGPSHTTEETETSRPIRKRKMPSTEPRQSSSNKQPLHDPQIDFMSGAIDRLQDISNCAAQTTKDDTYDFREICCVHVTPDWTSNRYQTAREHYFSTS